MTYAWDNDSTQNAHIKQMRDDRQKPTWKNIEAITCQELPCKDCLFYVLGKGCDRNEIKKWANSEYVEPPIDWTKVAVDTPILIRDNSSSKWGKRYFAKYENGIVYAWSKGTTSWSGDRCTLWKLAKLPERSSNEY